MVPMCLHCPHCLPHGGFVHDVNTGLMNLSDARKKDGHAQLKWHTPNRCPKAVLLFLTLLTLAQDQTTRYSKVSRVAPVGKVPVDER